jgi:thiol-disulfide isomerase/thioredoxin
MLYSKSIIDAKAASMNLRSSPIKTESVTFQTMDTVKRILLSMAFLLSIACNTVQQYFIPEPPAPEQAATEFPSVPDDNEDVPIFRDTEEEPIVPDTPDLPIAPELNSLAPDFVLSDTNGNTYKLSELRGNPVLLNFWATWCGPCLGEMPAIQSLAEQHPDLIVLAINGDGESYEDISNYQEEYGLTFPLLIDANEEVSDAYEIDAFPTTFFVDREGVIRHISDGAMQEREFTRILDSTILTHSSSNSDSSNTNTSPLSIDLPEEVWSFDITEAHIYEFHTLSEQFFSNYTLQTDVEITNSASEYHGLMLRQQDAKNFYSFRITPDGYFAFDVWHSSDHAFDTILGPLYSDAIFQGTGQVNTLAVVTSNENFKLYINGEYVDSISDTRFSSGKVGVISCTCDGSSATSSVFSNFSLNNEP